MPLVKLVSSGLGLAFEANAARKAHKVDKAARSHADSSSPGTSQTHQADADVINVSHQQARQLLDSGEAVPVDTKHHPHGKEIAYDAPPAYAEADNMDEADWQLDEATPNEMKSSSSNDRIDTLGPVPSGEEAKKHYVDKIVRLFLSQHPPPFETRASGNLPCPVIIPQRRPHNKSRGFVRAYAPVLANCDIDQATFMGFHKAMYKASQASPVFDVINIAAAIAGLVPSLAATITSIVVQAATKIAIEVQSRQRTNSFLNQMNDQFFRPRGLFCMVMKYNAQEGASHETVDTSSTIMKSLTTSDSRTKEQMKKFQAASGTTRGEVEMPEAAPLIFPELDRVEDIDENGKPRGGLKKTGQVIANYFDKRAQAKFAAENQGSTLASALPQERKFASRFGDPNNPVNSGSLISLVTGGYVDSRDSSRGQRGSHRDGLGSGRGGLIGGVTEFLSQRSVSSPPSAPSPPSPAPAPYGGFHQGYPQEAHGHQHERHRRRDDRHGDRNRNHDSPSRENEGPLPIGYVKRMLQPNMLYLMIVNMPTEEEMEEARAIVAASRR